MLWPPKRQVSGSSKACLCEWCAATDWLSAPLHTFCPQCTENIDKQVCVHRRWCGLRWLMLQASHHCWRLPRPLLWNYRKKRRRWEWALEAWEEWAAWIIRKLIEWSTSLWISVYNISCRCVNWHGLLLSCAWHRGPRLSVKLHNNNVLKLKSVNLKSPLCWKKFI